MAPTVEHVFSFFHGGARIHSFFHGGARILSFSNQSLFNSLVTFRGARNPSQDSNYTHRSFEGSCSNFPLTPSGAFTFGDSVSANWTPTLV